MASELTIYSIYKTQNEDKYFLLRTERPGFSNAYQTQEDMAYTIEQQKRDYMLAQLGTNFERIGEHQDYPIGEVLYLDNGNLELDVYYMETKSGWPWVILGTANSESEFLTQLNDDDDLLRLDPVGQPKHIKATFVIENDFDFSEIENGNIKDLRPE